MKNYFEKSEMRPNPSDYIECANLMTEVEDMAPSNSNVVAKIDKLEDGSYLTIITISATCGRFYSEATTNSLMSSLKRAQYSILKKLDHWKAVRFSLS